MTDHDFKRLNGLLAKLKAATQKAATTDGTFKKYHTSSMRLLKDFPEHLQHLEQGLRTAKMVVE